MIVYKKEKKNHAQKLLAESHLNEYFFFEEGGGQGYRVLACRGIL